MMIMTIKSFLCAA